MARPCRQGHPGHPAAAGGSLAVYQDGLAIWYKRLERGTFQLPSDLLPTDAKPVGAEISAGDLSLLLGGIELASVKRRKRFRHPAKPP